MALLRSTRRARHRRPLGRADLLGIVWPFAGSRSRSARHAAGRRAPREQVRIPVAVPAVEDIMFAPRLTAVGEGAVALRAA